MELRKAWAAGNLSGSDKASRLLVPSIRYQILGAKFLVPKFVCLFVCLFVCYEAPPWEVIASAMRRTINGQTRDTGWTHVT